MMIIVNQVMLLMNSLINVMFTVIVVLVAAMFECSARCMCISHWLRFGRTLRKGIWTWVFYIPLLNYVLFLFI